MALSNGTRIGVYSVTAKIAPEHLCQAVLAREGNGDGCRGGVGLGLVIGGGL